MELEERRALLLSKAMQIALHLPEGWMPRTATDSDDKDRMRFDHPSGMRFNLTLPHPHTHFHVRVWDWPKMLEYGRGNQFTEIEYHPSRLTPSRGLPLANIAISKTEQRIADEITTRVLNPYVEVWNLCKIHADMWTETAKKYKRDWEAVCKAAGLDSKCGSDSETIGGMWVDFERRNSTVKISMDVSSEKAITLIGLMRTLQG